MVLVVTVQPALLILSGPIIHRPSSLRD